MSSLEIVKQRLADAGITYMPITPEVLADGLDKGGQLVIKILPDGGKSVGIEFHKSSPNEQHHR